ncbi:MAG: GntR family transcriptional regulator [Prevotella sp.]|nr:GntR family transcriptional regulator [Prevotella sp.]
MMCVEIADAINDKILTGVYQAGRRVPSIRLTALDFQVNHNTVIRAYDLLEREGIIQNQRGIGFSVTAEAKDIIIHKRKEWFYHELLPDVFRQMRLLGIELNEIWPDYSSQNNSKIR